MSFKSEFKQFIAQGNVIDLAVGLVIGAAFGKIVNSMVEDILMPPLGMLIGGVNFTDLKYALQQSSVDVAGNPVAAVTINYGNFMQTAISFIIIALAVFVFIVKPMNAMKRKRSVTPDVIAPTKEEILLAEIRDLLKK